MMDATMSFRCDSCGEIVPWGRYGPTGLPDCEEGSIVEWVCDDCADFEFEDEL